MQTTARETPSGLRNAESHYRAVYCCDGEGEYPLEAVSRRHVRVLAIAKQYALYGTMEYRATATAQRQNSGQHL